MNKMKGFATCFIMCLTLMFVGSNSIIAAEYDAITPALAEAIQGAMQQANITGLSVALVDDQEIVWAEGFGYADKANDVKATPDTLYRVASVSKLLTATAIMQLVDQGKIDLDQPLQTYLPEFSVKSRFPDADPITVRHLLTHHSGLPSDWINGMQTHGDDQQALITRTFASLLEEIKDTYVANPPNTVFSYSNLSYSVLGHVVEHVSGQGFSAYVDEVLLKPLGMPASSFAFTPAMAPSLSKEYRNGEEQEYNWSRDIPAGALHSTVLDLGQFMSMMFADGKVGSQQILQPQTVTEMWRPQNDDVPLDFDVRWGLSWWLVDLGLGYAGKIAWHSGNVGMWNSLLVTLPEHKLGVVMLSNSGGAGAINFQIAPKILEHTLEAKTGITRPPVKPLEIVALSPDEVLSYEGVYTSSIGPIIMKSEGTDLYANAMGQSFKLLPHGEGRFSIEGVSDAELLIKTVNNRTALKLQGMAVGGLGFGERIEPGPISEIWQNRLGRYEVINGNPDFETFLTDIQLKYDRQVLVFEVMLPLLGMQVGLPIKPISDTEVITLGLGRNCGETISVVEVDGEDHLFYSGYLMKKTGALEKKPAAGNVYEDPQGRFSMPLIGDWTPVETDGTYARYAYADMDLAMSLIAIESDDVEGSIDSALRLVGVDPDPLTEIDRGAWNKWSIFYYSLGDGQGVTVLGQVQDGIGHFIVATGDEALTSNPPEDIMKTIAGFALSGGVILPTTVEELETYLNGVVGTTPPGLSISIATGGDRDLIYAHGFGMADRPEGMHATPDTVYHWGSVTKTVTATAMMQLREQGLVDLDAPVSDYLDYFPTQYPITVRNLLTHSSGLPEPHDWLMRHLRLEGQPLPDFDQMDREFYEELSSLMFEPGSQSAYVNPDYVTLGQIVAAASGQPYVEYVREHILTPLGLHHTDFEYSNEFMLTNAASPATSLSNAEALVVLIDKARGLGDGADFFRETDENNAWMSHFIVGESAGGGLMGPATEMVRYARMLLNGGELDGQRILNAESVELLRQVQLSTSGDPLGIGLAWHFGEDAGHPYIEHGGGGAGIHALLRIYLKDGFAIAIQANGTGFSRQDVANAAANVVFSMMGGRVKKEEPTAEAFTPPIADADGNEIPGSIAAIETVTLGGVEQTITLRGVDISNPVLLFLHGGPGLPSSPWVSWNNFQAELEANFVVVHWDQRGAGKSFSEDLAPEDMRLEHFVSDTLALTDILRERFEQDKIFLWGHSWGSGLGFETLKVNADPYYAYIASAVRPDWNSTQTMGYEWVLEQARQAKNSEAIQALESIQPFDPINREHINMRAHFLSLYRGGDFYTEGLGDKWLDYVLSGQSPEYPVADVEKTMAGLEFTRQTISLEILQSGYDLFRDFPESSIPVYFFAGRHDHETPGELAEDYYNVLEAPAKHFTWFENSAHNMMYDEPDKTNQELIRIANEVLNP